MTRTLTTDIRALDPIHDNRHKLGTGPLARESMAYMIQIPEEQIGGFIYTWINGEGLAGSAVTLYGPGIGPEPLLEKFDGIAMSPDADFFDWRVKNLHFRLGELLETASISYKSELFDIEYNFTATQPAYAYSSHKDGCPQWIAHERFEQHGLVSGYVKVGGREIALQGYAQRDHSWGVRDWGLNQHWKWVHAQAGPELGVHFWKLESMGKTLIRGFVDKDQHIAQVVDVDIDLEINDDLKTRTVHATIYDSAGRTTTFQGVAYATFPLCPDPMITLFESPIVAHIDGVKGGGCCEVLWMNSLIEYVNNK
ncbi:MAG: hypothetical protein KKF24_11740 [Gammaproteobacteria bacterium]|nr:hypothetical protein [Gammaproteobacteria bacterium]MBU1833353.1 hypothetical protein [Gammaproteobacteria bacterium]